LNQEQGKTGTVFSRPNTLGRNLNVKRRGGKTAGKVRTSLSLLRPKEEKQKETKKESNSKNYAASVRGGKPL